MIVRRGFKRKLASVVLGMAIVCGTLLAGELIARAYFRRHIADDPRLLREFLVEPDARTIYRLRANVRAENVKVMKFDRYFRPTIAIRTTIQINSKGFRDREFGRKPPGTERVFCLGDSITFGEEVPVEKTYPKVLDNLLGEEVEVINGGVFGYSTLQLIGRLRTVLSLEADAVVIQFPVNNAGRERLPDRMRVGNVGAMSWLVHHSRLLFLLSGRRDDGGGRTLRVTPEESASHLEQMVKLGTMAGVKLAILFPAHRMWVPEYDFAVLRERYLEEVKKVVERHNLPFVDAQERFAEIGMEKLMVDACHLNELGHKFLAGLLLPIVRQMVGE